MVSGPESSRASTRSASASNQSIGGGGGGGSDAKVPTEEELGALLDQAMQSQQQGGSGEGKRITHEEQQKFLSAMKDPEFRSLLNDYMLEISDPTNRAETEQYLSQLESEQRVPDDKELVKPTPGFVVKAKWSDGGANSSSSSSSSKKVFVNVCSSGKLQPPSSTTVAPSSATDHKSGASWNLPYSVGPERMESDKGGAPVATFDVCFHTRTLELATTQRQFLDMVVKVGLDAVETLMRDSRRAPTGELSRKFHVLKGVSYKSGDPVTMCLRKPNTTDGKKGLQTGSKSSRSNQDAPQRPQATKEPTPKTTDAGNQQDVIDVAVPNSHASDNSKAEHLIDMKEEDASPLLRQVATKKTAAASTEATQARKLRFQMIYRGKFELMHHMQAEHGNIVPADRNRPKELVIEVEFPLATSAKGIRLDVSESAVRISAERYDELSIALPYAVLETKGSAKFDKKQRKLVVTLPVQPPPPPEPKAVSIMVEEDEDDGEEDEAQEPQHEAPGPDRSTELESMARATPPAPKDDEFRMLRETALMVANDPLVMARKASQSARPSAKTEVAYDDMPPLESCSEDEDESGNDRVGELKREAPASDKSGTSSNAPQSSAPTSTEAVASTPAFTTKETSACVSFLVAVANVTSASVKLSFPSPTSMELSFTASDGGQEDRHSAIKTYALSVSLPHAVRPETAEVDVATENMVVILEKTPPPSNSSASRASASSPSAPIAPVARFQNDLLYELD